MVEYEVVIPFICSIDRAKEIRTMIETQNPQLIISIRKVNSDSLVKQV